MQHLLLPGSCGACGAPGPSPCAQCWRQLRPAPPGAIPPGLDELVALLAYDGAGRELVARLKYRNHRASLDWLASGLAGLIAEVLPAVLDAGGDTIATWAPTTPARRRSRGFDQAELLSRAVARRLHVPAMPLLHRLPGPAQTGRTGAERRAGGPGFVTSSAPALRPGGVVVVVDDVVTSGATLAAAARTLRGAGAARVIGAVAARTPSRAP